MNSEKEENQNKEPIVIDISNIDTKSVKKQEYFLQKDGFKKVAELLNKEATGKKIKKKNSSLQRSHNTIFINGQRGSGKTQFLISIRNYLKKNDKKTLKKLYFIKSIDPTLLHDNESFLTIIIAKILNQLEEENKLNDLEKEEKTEFYKYLSNISLAIDGVIHQHNKDKSSLEHIAQDQTSLRLERYLDEFFYKVTKIVQKRKIVLLIDDIDMAFEKGFEVLEVIRKYLSSPYIVPIVTGDEELYQKIVSNHFSKLINKQNKETSIINISAEHNSGDITINSSNFEKEDENKKTDILTLDYLTKILPLDKNIKIESIYELALNQEIIFQSSKNHQYKFNRKNSNKSDFYQFVYDTFDKEKISASRFEKNLFENSFRQIIQYLHGEYKAQKHTEQFGLKDLSKLLYLSKKYRLNLLEDIRTYLTYREEGLLSFNQNDFKQAIFYFNKSIELKRTAEVFGYRGNAYMNLKKYQEASENYIQAFNIENNEKFINLYIESLQSNYNERAYINIVKMYDILDKYNESIQYLLKLYEIGTTTYKLHIELMTTYFLLDNMEKVEEYNEKYKTASKQGKTSPKVEAFYQLLLILNNILLDKDVDKEFKTWIKKYPSHNFTYNFSKIKRWSRNKKQKDILLKYISLFEKQFK